MKQLENNSIETIDVDKDLKEGEVLIIDGIKYRIGKVFATKLKNKSKSMENFNE